MEEKPAVIDDSRRSSSSPESLRRSSIIHLEEDDNRESPSMNATGGEGNGIPRKSGLQWSPSHRHRRTSCFHYVHDLSDFSKRASDDSLGKCNPSSQKQGENNSKPSYSTEHEEKSSFLPDCFSSELDKRHSASTSSREIRSSGDILFRLIESLDISNKYIEKNLYETSLNLPGSTSTTEGDSSPDIRLKGNCDPRTSRRQDGARMRRRLKTSRTALQDLKRKESSTTISKPLPTPTCDQKPIYSNTDEGKKLLNKSRDNTIEHRMRLQQRLGSVCQSEKSRFPTPLSTSSPNQSSPMSEEEDNDNFFLKVFGASPRKLHTSSLGKQKSFTPRDVDDESHPAFGGRRKSVNVDGYFSLPGAASPDLESYSSVIPKHTTLPHKNMARRKFCLPEPSNMKEDEDQHTAEETTTSKKPPSHEASAFHISKDSSGPARLSHKHNSWFSERNEIGYRLKQDSLKSNATLNTGSTDITSNAPSPGLGKQLVEEQPPKFLLGRGRSLSAGSPRSGIHEAEGRVVGSAGDKTTSEQETFQTYYTTNILNQKSSCSPSSSRTPSLSPSDLRVQRSLPLRSTRKGYEETSTNSTERDNCSEVTSTCTGEIRSPYEEQSPHLQFVRKYSLSSKLEEYPSERSSRRCSVDYLHPNIGSRENDTMDASSLTSSTCTTAEYSCSVRTKISTTTEESQKTNKNELARLRRRLKLHKISPENICQSQSQSNTMPVRKEENEIDKLLESHILVNQQKKTPAIQSADETTVDKPVQRRVVKLPPIVKHKTTEEDSMCAKSAKMSSHEDLRKSEEITKNVSLRPATEDIQPPFIRKIPVPCSSLDADSESQNDAESSLEVTSSIECSPRDTSFSEQRPEPAQLITHVSKDEKGEKEEVCGNKVENSSRIDNDTALTKDPVIHDGNESQISSDTSEIVRNMFKHNYLYYDSEESEERSVPFKAGSYSPRTIFVKPINVVNRTEVDCHVPENSPPHLKTHDTENVVMPRETGDFRIPGETSNSHACLPVFEEQSPAVDMKSLMSVFQVKAPAPQQNEDSIHSLSADSTPSIRRCCCLRRTCKAIRNFFFAPSNKHYL